MKFQTVEKAKSISVATQGSGIRAKGPGHARNLLEPALQHMTVEALKGTCAPGVRPSQAAEVSQGWVRRGP